jgi:hypothetical protein
MVIKPVPGQGVDAAHPLANGLVGFWPFAEGQGTLVYDAAGSRPLVLKAAPVITAEFHPSQCWQMTARGPIGQFLETYTNTSDNIGDTTASTPLFTADVVYTLAIRFQVSQASTPTQQGILSLALTMGASNPSYLLRQTGANVHVLVMGSGYRAVIAGVQANTWYTVASRSTVTQNAHYRDGVQVLAPAANLTGTYSPIWPHHLWAATGFQWPARVRIDWIGVWSRDLTPGEHLDIGSDPDAIWAMFPRRLVRRTVYGRAGSRRVRV